MHKMLVKVCDINCIMWQIMHNISVEVQRLEKNVAIIVKGSKLMTVAYSDEILLEEVQTNPTF